MTPETLHQRILLHELRTILLDETREGDQLPQEWREAIQKNPHATFPYQVLGHSLDEEGSDLGELCRIQCELIDVYDGGSSAFVTSAAESGMETRLSREPENHPFKNDFEASALLAKLTSNEWVPHTKLLARRWEIVEPLYGPGEMDLPYRDFAHDNLVDVLVEHGFDPQQTKCLGNDADSVLHCTQPRKLGRTTRMLTDVLRYCCLNRKSNVSVITPFEQVTATREQFQALLTELLGGKHDEYVTHYAHFPFGEGAVLIASHSGGWPLFEEGDITFTDHACQRQENLGIAYDALMDPLTHLIWPNQERSPSIDPRFHFHPPIPDDTP